jgi:hypothetical protein
MKLSKIYFFVLKMTIFYLFLVKKPFLRRLRRFSIVKRLKTKSLKRPIHTGLKTYETMRRLRRYKTMSIRARKKLFILFFSRIYIWVENSVSSVSNVSSHCLCGFQRFFSVSRTVSQRLMAFKTSVFVVETT